LLADHLQPDVLQDPAWLNEDSRHPSALQWFELSNRGANDRPALGLSGFFAATSGASQAQPEQEKS
jgi:hypothetical protein